MHPPAPQDKDIASVVSRIFSDLRNDMDSIVNSAELGSSHAVVAGEIQETQHQQGPPAATSSQAAVNVVAEVNQGPELCLHGRTQSEAAGYYDLELSSPVYKLPEVLADDSSSTTQTNAIESAAPAVSPGPVADAGPAFAEQDFTDAAMPSMQDSPARLRSFSQPKNPSALLTAPAALWDPDSDPMVTGNHEHAEADEKPEPLSYRELLDRALSWNPKLMQPSSGGASTSGRRSSSADWQRRSTGSSSTAASPASISKKARPSSTGRAAVSSRSPHSLHDSGLLGFQRGSARQALSKFPGSQRSVLHSSHFSLTDDGSPTQASAALPASEAAATGRGRIFKEGSMAALQAAAAARAEVHQEPNNGQAALKAWGRSRSAPREQAAARRHVLRLSTSPTRAVAGGRDLCFGPKLQQQQQEARRRSRSNPRDAVIERLYTLGVAKQTKRSQGPPQESSKSVRLTEDQWSRVTSRLYIDAEVKEERMRQRRELADRQLQALMISPRPRSRSTSRSTSPASPGRQGAAAVSGSSDGEAEAAAFHRRQMALLQKRAELAAQKRPSDEDELEECTFHPQINPTSRSLHRSVKALHMWEARRRLSVYEKALDKCEHEYDGYTFAPTINPLSRRIALASYAAAPDPSRPWTSSPTHFAAPATQRASRQSLSPSPDAMRMLRDAMPPAHVMSLAGNKQRYAQEEAAYAPAALSIGTSQLDSATVPIDSNTQQAAQQQGVGAMSLPPGTVLGIPVALPALAHSPQAVSGTALGSRLPEDAVVISLPLPDASISLEGSASQLLADTPMGEGTAAFVSLTPDGPPPPGAAAAAPAPASSPEQTEAAAAAPASPLQHAAAEPQRALAALKLAPAQAQKGLEAGQGSYNKDGGSSSSSGGPAVVRGSSHGGVAAPGTPQIGGGTEADGSGSTAANEAFRSGRISRDDSAAGHGAPGPLGPRKVSTGGSYFSLVSMPATFNRPGSPLSKKQQHADASAWLQGPCSASALDPPHKLGWAGSPYSEQLQHPGLQTVPAFHVTAVPEPRRAESSSSGKGYSQKFQSKLNKQVSLGGKQPAAAPAGSRGGAWSPDPHRVVTVLGTGDISPPESPTFAELKAAWKAKESQSRQGSAAGLKSPHGAAGGDARPLTSLLSGSLVTAPETPTYNQHQQQPLASSSSLHKQYSTAQLLNAHYRQSLGGSGTRASCPGVLPGSGSGNAASHTPTIVAPQSPGSKQQAPAAAAIPAGWMASGQQQEREQLVALHPTVLMLQQLTEGAEGPSSAQQGHSCASHAASASPKQLLPGCLSILSLPDLTAVGGNVAATESCNGSLQQQLQSAEKAEGLLEQTRSVPFELLLSPRSKFLVGGGSSTGSSSSAAAIAGTSVDASTPLGQQLLALLGQAQQQQQQGQRGGDAADAAVKPSSSSDGSIAPANTVCGTTIEAAADTPQVVMSAADTVAQLLSGGSWTFGGAHVPAAASSQQLVQSLLRPMVATSPHLLDSSAATPAWATPTSSSRNMLQQPQRAVHSSPGGNSSSSNSSSSHLGLVATAGNRSYVVADVPAAETAPSYTAAIAAGAGASTGPTAVVGAEEAMRAVQAEGESVAQPDDATAADLAAELAALMKPDASLTPEEMAQRVARTFVKTISRLNVPSDVLQKTMAALELLPATPASTLTGPPLDAAGGVQALSASSTAAAAAAAAVDDLPEADNIQQLLERVSGSGMLLLSSSQQPERQQQQHTRKHDDEQATQLLAETELQQQQEQSEQSSVLGQTQQQQQGVEEERSSTVTAQQQLAQAAEDFVTGPRLTIKCPRPGLEVSVGGGAAASSAVSSSYCTPSSPGAGGMSYAAIVRSASSSRPTSPRATSPATSPRMRRVVSSSLSGSRRSL